MNNRLLQQQKIERHLSLWIYLLPVIGIIPSMWTLYRPQKNNQLTSDEDREQNKACHLSLKLAIVWLFSYSSLSLSAAGASEIMSFRLLYANAILTTAYFLSCIILLARLSKKN